MDNVERQVKIYRTPDGQCPYLRWLQGLRDDEAKQRIRARIGRLRLGNPGHVRSVGGAVHELKIGYGSDYRVYFGNDERRLVLLPIGGDKSQ